MREVVVGLDGRSYTVSVGRAARRSIGEKLPSAVRRVAVVTQDGVPDSLIPDFPDREVHVLRIGSGEEHKNLTTIGMLCSSMASRGFTRHDAVVGVGGGLVTDVAGFTAATYHRGVTVAHVATTLLAMIDAAVGGKTGVNLPEGKNLVGAFWQPIHVACDLEALDTLPVREMRCGLGEMAKYDFIARRRISELPMEDRIADCVAIKAEIVSRDERESGDRALLNYGHTLGHALETASGYALAHGEAVAIGLLFAAEVARCLGRISEERVDDHYRTVLEEYRLDVALPPGIDFGHLVTLMLRDKKSTGALTFVLDGAEGLQVVPDVPRDALSGAWHVLCERLGVRAR